MVFAESEFADYYAYDESGNRVKISDYEGEVLFVNVWATWCIECREEMPYINKLFDKFSSLGIRFINISIDQNPADAIDMAKNMQMKTDLWYDPDEQAIHTFKMFGPPVTLLIGIDGQLIHKWPGKIIEGTGVEEKLFTSIGLLSEEIISENSFERDVTMAIAFGAGVLSFLSPCILPLIPSYIAFIAGTSIKELSEPTSNRQPRLKIKTRILSKGAFFILGFSSIFVGFGLGVSYVGSMFNETMLWVERIGGMIIIVFGLHLLGILKIKLFNRQKTFALQNPPAKKLGLLFVGMGFGAGWTPCIGPILASILTLAATSDTFWIGGQLLGMYSLGLAIPFLLSAFAIDQFTLFFQKIKRWLGWIERSNGILLILIGLVLLTGSIPLLISFFENLLK